MIKFTNHFLVAMPDLNGTIFDKSVIYICEHDVNGAMGLIINNPVNLSVSELLVKSETINPYASTYLLEKPVFSGGPESSHRGFVIHTKSDSNFSTSFSVNSQISITTSTDVLSILGTKDEPRNYMITLGYSHWKYGELEQEIAMNKWLTVEYDYTVLFDTPMHQKWQEALHKLGINPLHLANHYGRC